MKKNILLALFMMVSFGSFAQSFELSKFRAGAGLIYATDINNIGLTFKGVYSFTNEWEGAFGYSHVFKNNLVSSNIFDFNAHYVFMEIDDQMNLYGIGGLSITSVKFHGSDLYPVNDYYTYDSSDSSLGLNVGVGMNYKLTEVLNLAPEACLTFTDGTYFRIGASIQYLF